MYVMSPPKIPVMTVDLAKRHDFRYNTSVENDYNNYLNMVAERIKSFLSRFTSRNSIDLNSMVQALHGYSDTLKDWANRVVHRISNRLDEDDRRQWLLNSHLMSREMVRKIRSSDVRPLIEIFLQNNVHLIQSMPIKAAERVQQIVLKNFQTGALRSEDLAEQVMQVGNVTRNRAKLIARTETSRISTAFSQIRSRELGMEWYIWRTSQDARVRPSHKNMKNVLVRWSEPPAPEKLLGEKRIYPPYHPGQIFNCRCFAQPVIRLEDITFPVRTFINGRIIQMNKADFIRISQGQIPRVA